MAFSQSRKERFAKIVNGWKPLTVFGRQFILDVCQDSECTPEKQINYFPFAKFL